MGTIIKNELIRIVHEKKIYIFMIILGVITIGMALGIESLLRVTEGSIENGIVPPGFALMSLGEIEKINSQNYPMMILGVVVGLVLPLMSVVFLSGIITSDISDGRIRYTLVGPISRWKVILGKSLSTIVIMFFLMGFMLILSYLSGYIFIRSGTYIVDDVELEGVSIMLHMLEVYMKSYMIIAIFTISLTPICILLKKVTSVIMFSVGLIIGASLISIIFRAVSKYLITAYFKAFSNMVNKAISTEEIIIFIAYVVISVILAVAIFNKKEFTE
ncbi:ABC transporter permease subunit [Oceanirhabdus sp. W0125-5]|uniref:ABC transporter permease subunit n=1 Tax=Oceanirhabdus sp. W0125-5 TaxID=2999116 RepID=UPI0022F2D281|nr:ABC transporter permease subunit [Oceanirhabdus sp. W0125-5]WBW98335.1 ABC transporter permease subunit [Oceanirhabdus sp. W0125-5]